jgi:hypothetical protein
MKQAAAMLSGDRILGGSHFEDDPAILQQGGTRVVDKKLFQRTGEFPGRDFRLLAGFQFASRPAPAGGQLRDVGGVVAAMPVVVDDHLFDGLTAVLRMHIPALPVLLAE